MTVLESIEENSGIGGCNHKESFMYLQKKDKSKHQDKCSVLQVSGASIDKKHTTQYSKSNTGTRHKQHYQQ